MPEASLGSRAVRVGRGPGDSVTEENAGPGVGGRRESCLLLLTSSRGRSGSRGMPSRSASGLLAGGRGTSAQEAASPQCRQQGDGPPAAPLRPLLPLQPCAPCSLFPMLPAPTAALRPLLPVPYIPCSPCAPCSPAPPAPPVPPAPPAPPSQVSGFCPAAFARSLPPTGRQKLPVTRAVFLSADTGREYCSLEALRD